MHVIQTVIQSQLVQQHQAINGADHTIDGRPVFPGPTTSFLNDYDYWKTLEPIILVLRIFLMMLLHHYKAYECCMKTDNDNLFLPRPSLQKSSFIRLTILLWFIFLPLLQRLHIHETSLCRCSYNKLRDMN